MPGPRQKIDPPGVGPDLLARFKSEAPGWQRERMLAIKLAMEGTGTQQVADDLGRSQATVQSWINRFRPLAPSRRRYQNGYLYGALEIGGSSSEFLFAPTLNKEWDPGFLDQIAAHDPEAVHIVIGDGAGFHHKKGEGTLPEKVRIITLPAYGPELNPVEKLWDIVKDGIRNRDWADLDELEDKITERIKPYWEDATRVTRLVGNGYLLSELNAVWKTDFRQYN